MSSPPFRKISLLVLVFTLISRFVPGDTDIRTFAEETRGYVQWNPLAERGTLVVEGERFVFSLAYGGIFHNYRERLPGRAYRGEAGAVFLDTTAVEVIERRLPERSDTPIIAAVLIDPGHGGKDPGALGVHTIDGKTVTIKEKDVVLEVSRQLYESLLRRYPDKRIMLTRDDDSFISLEKRVDTANSIPLGEQEAIIYISIHANASLNRKAKGFEVWYLPPDYRRTLIDQKSIQVESEEALPILNTMLEEEYTTESILLAQRILDSMEHDLEDTTENRGLKEEVWFVVRKAKMPSVLIELGFVTNKEEADNLLDPVYLQKLSRAIYNGTSKFIDQFESSKGFTE